jgi:hypothetical protein
MTKSSRPDELADEGTEARPATGEEMMRNLMVVTILSLLPFAAFGQS